LIAANARSKWPSLMLRDVGKLHCGQSPPSKDLNTSSEGTVYITGPEHWDGYTIQVNKWTTNPKRLVPDGCVFITVKGSGVGKIFPGISGAIGRDIYAFEPDESHSAKYIEYALKFTIQDILRKAVGDIPGISKNHILDHEVMMPPREVQDAIVAEIETQFSRLDEAIANLKRVKANLKRYKAAVLKAAVEGRLVETEADLARAEGRSYETGAQLLERMLEARRSQWKGKGRYKEPVAPDIARLPELPEGWVWASPSQLSAGEPYSLAIGPFGSNLKVNDYAAAGVPLVFVRNIRTASFGGADTVFVTPEKAKELRAHQVTVGDLLVTKMGDPPGDVCMYPSDRPDAVITADCIKLRLTATRIDSTFVVYAIESQPVRRQVHAITKGVAQLKVSLARFRSIGVPLPPLAEQQRIVARVDRLLSLAAEAENQADANHRRAERLRQSMLRQAFSDRLGLVDCRLHLNPIASDGR